MQNTNYYKAKEAHDQLTKATRPKTKQKNQNHNYAIMAPTDYESHNSLQLPFIWIVWDAIKI